MPSAVDICNASLSHIQSEPITSLSDGTVAALRCSEHYENTVRLALTMPGGAAFRWRFAAKQAQLTTETTAPIARWTHAYVLPGDLVALHGAVAGDGGRLIEFDRYGNTLCTDQPAPIVLDYTARPDESVWPPYFVSGVIRDLAMALAVSVAADTNVAKIAAQLFDWGAARRADSQQQTARVIRGTRLTAARFGGGFGGGWR